MNGVSWSIRFQQALGTWPCINDLGSGAVQVTNVLHQNPLSEDRSFDCYIGLGTIDFLAIITIKGCLFLPNV